MPRSFIDKHDNHKHPAQVETLAKPMWGLKRGQTIAIATPKDVSAFFKRVRAGKTRTMDDLRASLAKKYAADAACPLTTGIFARISAEAALEHMQAGAKPSEVAPFWRVIEPTSPLAKKLSCGPDFIREMRLLEGVAEAAPRAKKATAKKKSARATRRS
ncbi:MAG: hypothetical protein JNN10_05345 [Sphingopyxis sp.]|uniref:hypothetical protein n=1 Tax=Sphingopyxis sp. TaxID=1908224 RepID=UPI001A5CEBEF|nr:hypothetical protein [Sphingopyxis sp.]MBL9065698.1 hypothetical protein [Sphingopyxis sp.]